MRYCGPHEPGALVVADDLKSVGDELEVGVDELYVGLHAVGKQRVLADFAVPAAAASASARR